MKHLNFNKIVFYAYGCSEYYDESGNIMNNSDDRQKILMIIKKSDDRQKILMIVRKF